MSDDKPALGPSAGEGPEDGEAVRPAAAARPLRPTGKRTRRAAVGVLEDDAEPAEAAASDSASAESDADSEDKAKRTKAAKTKQEGSRVNPFAFVWNYLKQVVAELRKVIWPNRKQMVTYTTVVLVFLTFMVTLIGLADLGLVRLVGIIFG